MSAEEAGKRFRKAERRRGTSHRFSIAADYNSSCRTSTAVHFHLPSVFAPLTDLAHPDSPARDTFAYVAG